MKYVIVIIDGASGWPCDDLGGRTTLEAARTPNLDALARSGSVGLSYTVPADMEPSSAIACMSVLGFDPARYYAGRGPIEAMALGIELAAGQAALRCNLVTVIDGVLRSYAGGNIHSVESHPIIADLDAALGDARVAFHAGVNFRHILTVRDGGDLLATHCTPPHDITDHPIADHLPEGPAAALLIDLMERSRVLLDSHPVNRDRVARGELPVTQIWPFWPGLQAVLMPGFLQTYGRRAALTSAVDLLRGLAKQASIDYLDIAGVTDGNDNDFAAQMAGALSALERHDVVFVHVEAPDAAGHEGDAAAKVAAVEQVDALMVPQVTALGGGVRLLVQPDHPTPLALKTHVVEPVPFVLWGEGIEPNGATAYSEAQAAATRLSVNPGHRMMSMLLGERRE